MTKRAKKPTENQFEIAIMWLQANEGDEGEGDACEAVADWIERWMDADILKQAARAAGVPVSQVRKRLAGNRAEPVRLK